MVSKENDNRFRVETLNIDYKGTIYLLEKHPLLGMAVTSKGYILFIDHWMAAQKFLDFVEDDDSVVSTLPISNGYMLEIWDGEMGSRAGYQFGGIILDSESENEYDDYEKLVENYVEKQKKRFPSKNKPHRRV